MTKKMTAKWLISILLLSLGAVACVHYPSQKSIQVLEANEARVAKCKFLGQVYGEGHYPFLAIALEIAKENAKKKAAEIGATHVFWTEIGPGIKPFVVGRAYDCPRLEY